MFCRVPRGLNIFLLLRYFAYAKTNNKDRFLLILAISLVVPLRPTYSAFAIGSSPQFLKHFSVNLARSAKIDNSISPIKSLNQMSNSKISFKLASTDYHPTCVTPSFRPVNFRNICLNSWPPVQKYAP